MEDASQPPFRAAPGCGLPDHLRAMRARAFPAINEREIEMLRLAAVATDLYRRMAANLPQDHLPGDADDVRLARDLAASLSALTST